LWADLLVVASTRVTPSTSWPKPEVVALAAPQRPPSEDRQGEELAPAEEGATAGAMRGRGVVGLPPVVYPDAQ
jgi:hypothetical protein